MIEKEATEEISLSHTGEKWTARGSEGRSREGRKAVTETNHLVSTREVNRANQMTPRDSEILSG